jgi:EAL domain-containing protein (putative c-di-GMP-specific phosphodiesterase class I)
MLQKMQGGAMKNQEPGDQVPPAVVARQETVPRVCIADARRSIRTFIAEALGELGFATFECASATDLEAMLASGRTDLVVIGSSAGIEACEMVELLAARQFGGKVLVVGPRVSPMVSAIRGLSEKLGLAMLPLLPTPFGNGDLCECVAALLPGEAPPLAPLVTTAPLRSARHQVWYLPKIDARRLALSGAAAVNAPRHGAPESAQGGRLEPADGDCDPVAAAMPVIARVIEDWQYFAARHGHVEIAVNLPIAFFRHPDATDTLCRQMPDHPAFEGLIVEISAAEVIHNLDLARNVARRLRHRNIAVSIAELGMEWPSFLTLHDLPFVELKVDPQFVAGCANDRLQQAACRRVLDLADAIGARTVADGVASEADFLALRDMGFHQAQGPLFAKPMSAEEFARSVINCGAMAPR